MPDPPEVRTTELHPRRSTNGLHAARIHAAVSTRWSARAGALSHFGEARFVHSAAGMRTTTGLSIALALASGCAADALTEDELLGSAEEELVGYALGISDSDGETFSHPAFRGLRVHRARAVVPYDVAERPAGDGRRRSFEGWLASARAHGVEPFVTMYLSRSVTTASGQFLAPDAEEFRRAFRAFRRTYPDVTLIAPWNEPNFREHELRTPNGRRAFYAASCPNETVEACGPLAAAMYYRIARRECPRCTIVAGEFAVGDLDYMRAYKRFLRSHRPKVWSIHPYVDVNRFQQSGNRRAAATRAFLAELSGTWARADDGTPSNVWLTEVGAYYQRPCEPTHRACSSGRIVTCEGDRCRVFGDDSQERAARFLMGMPEISRRITRIYYYNWQNACGPGGSCPQQDRGVIAPVRPGGPLGYDTAGRRRGAYHVLATRGGRLPRRPPSGSGSGSGSATGSGTETASTAPSSPTDDQCGIRCCDGTLVQVQTGDAAECRAQYTHCAQHDWSMRIRYEGALLYERASACFDAPPPSSDDVNCGVRCCDGSLHQVRTGNDAECRAQYTYCAGHGRTDRIRFEGALIYERAGGC